MTHSGGIWSGLLAGLRGAEGLVRICLPTVWDAMRGRLTQEACSRRLAWWSQRAMADARVDIRIEGLENLAAAKTFLIMSNHLSFFDILLLFHAVSPGIRMVTKKELFKVPLWGQALREAGFISIDRRNREQAIKDLAVARDTLNKGIYVWIAPEGTRSRPGQLRPFKKGGFMLALETGVPILPIGLAGPERVMPKGALVIRLGEPVAVVIGEPIPVAGKDRDTLMAETREAMEQLCTRAEALRSGTASGKTSGSPVALG